MKISKKHLNKIIKEEIEAVLSETTDAMRKKLLGDLFPEKKPKPEQQPEQRPLSYLKRDDIETILDFFSNLDPRFKELTVAELEQEFENDEDDDLFFEQEEVKAAQQAQADLEKMLGAMTINIRKWGTYSKDKEAISEERQIIQNYVSMVGGSSPDEILRNLASSFSSLEQGQCDPQTAGNCNLGKLVSQIQLLNTMSTILNDFGGSEAGFIMEAFLSAVFPGGELVPIGKGTIADFFIHGKDGRADYSLKTTDKKAKIGGSVTSLVKSIKDKPMIYYVFAKEKGTEGGTASVTVYKFEINLDNVGKILGLRPKEVQELVQSEETGYLKRKYGKFSLDSYTYQRLSEKVAVLTLDPVKLHQAAECELASIKQQMLDIQSSYKSLAYDMSKYFSTMSSQSATQTKNASEKFYNVVTENVKGDDSCND